MNFATDQIVPIKVPSGYLRVGILKSTEDTRIKKIDGLVCGVTREEDGKARIYVLLKREGTAVAGAKGPYMVNSDDIKPIPNE